MQKVASLVTVRYIPFLKRGQGAKIFYRDLVLDYRERFISEGVRGPIYHDDPSLKKGVYCVPEVFAQATLFAFASPKDPNRLVIKTIYDYSPLLCSRAGLKFLKERTLPSTFNYDIETLEQSRRPTGLLSRFNSNTNGWELDLLRATGLINAIPSAPAAEKEKALFIEQIHSALKHYQFCPSKIEPDRDVSDKWGLLGYVNYKSMSPGSSYVIKALESLIKI